MSDSGGKRQKTEAVIRKVGDEYCVFSHDGKNLGCSPSMKGAEKRLQQVEFFKHKKKTESDMSNFEPDRFGDTNHDLEKAVTPLGIGNKSLSRVGTIVGKTSSQILDTREHFPILTENQARSAVKRVGQMTQAPPWFSGSIDQLQKMVYLSVASQYPDIQIPIDLHLEAAMARLVTANSRDDAGVLKNSKKFKGGKVTKSQVSDALAILSGGGVKDEKPSVVIDGVKVKNPEDNPTKVPGIPRKNLQSEASYDDRHAIARSLMDMIEDKKKELQSAEKVAKRLETKGLTSEEFKNMMLFLQEDILHELLRNGVKADENTAAMKRVLKNRKTGDE